jgi:hypothetical protein
LLVCWREFSASQQKTPLLAEVFAGRDLGFFKCISVHLFGFNGKNGGKSFNGKNEGKNGIL